MEHHDTQAPDEPPAIMDRPDTGGPWSRAWPLIALALIGLIAVRACMQPPSTPPAAPSSAPSSR